VPEYLKENDINTLDDANIQSDFKNITIDQIDSHPLLNFKAKSKLRLALTGKLNPKSLLPHKREEYWSRMRRERKSDDETNKGIPMEKYLDAMKFMEENTLYDYSFGKVNKRTPFTILWQNIGPSKKLVSRCFYSYSLCFLWTKFIHIARWRSNKSIACTRTKSSYTLCR
jgi:hypothetical protein